jgi:hypothetical protein
MKLARPLQYQDRVSTTWVPPSKEIAMFTKIHSEVLKNAVCMLLAAVIVSSSLTIGALGIQSIEQSASEVLVSQS